MNLIRVAVKISFLSSLILPSLSIYCDAARSQQQSCVISADGFSISQSFLFKLN
jgi:hypothetical protein